MKGKNADILLELIRMKKSHKKADWYKERREELFKLMKYENHKDHVGYDFTRYDIDIDTTQHYNELTAHIWQYSYFIIALWRENPICII